MTELNIRPARAGDLPAILETYRRARQFMREHGDPDQWGDRWPPEPLVREDIRLARSQVVEAGGRLAGVFVFLPGPDPTYRVIEDGAWLSDAPYGVIHRIASAQVVPGVGRAAIGWAWQRIPHLRIDTHPDNVVMQNLLAGCGFQRCGIIHVPQDPAPRWAYEKLA